MSYIKLKLKSSKSLKSMTEQDVLAGSQIVLFLGLKTKVETRSIKVQFSRNIHVVQQF